jgi:hypothetical protein
MPAEAEYEMHRIYMGWIKPELFKKIIVPRQAARLDLNQFGHEVGTVMNLETVYWTRIKNIREIVYALEMATMRKILPDGKYAVVQEISAIIYTEVEGFHRFIRYDPFDASLVTNADEFEIQSYQNSTRFLHVSRTEKDFNKCAVKIIAEALPIAL